MGIGWEDQQALHSLLLNPVGIALQSAYSPDCRSCSEPFLSGSMVDQCFAVFRE